VNLTQSGTSIFASNRASATRKDGAGINLDYTDLDKISKDFIKIS